MCINNGCRSAFSSTCVLTSVLHGSSGITPTGPSFKWGWPPRLTGLGCLILCFSTVNADKEVFIPPYFFFLKKVLLAVQINQRSYKFLDNSVPPPPKNRASCRPLLNSGSTRAITITNSATSTLQQLQQQRWYNWVTSELTQRRTGLLLW